MKEVNETKEVKEQVELGETGKEVYEKVSEKIKDFNEKLSDIIQSNPELKDNTEKLKSELTKLETELINEFKDELKEEGYKESTIDAILGVIQSLLPLAINALMICLGVPPLQPLPQYWDR